MSNTKAFKYLINASNNKIDPVPSSEGGSSLGEKSPTIIQTSPSWVLTFVRWETRDLLRTEPTSYQNPLKTRNLIIVENDCLQLTVSYNKGTLTPNMTAVLVETDINYSTAIHPGDFVFVNILNWENDAKKIVEKAKNLKPINEINDGFKGFFKIQSVRKTVSVDPNSGIKTTLTTIEGFAFTEFNNTIYFDPNLINESDLKNLPLFSANITEAWSTLVGDVKTCEIEKILTFLISSLIGSGPPESLKDVQNMVFSPNNCYLLPNNVGNLLGITTSQTQNEKNYVSTVSAKDIFIYIFGIQNYDNLNSENPSIGMNPSNFEDKKQETGFLFTDKRCGGRTQLRTDYWNKIQVWSILNQYINSPLNELYTCFKLSTSGKVLPTVVFRQIPFTSENFEFQNFSSSEDYQQDIYVTKFLSLPRWKIGSESVYNLNIGTDEALRINFVQYYAYTNNNDYTGASISGQIASKNYVVDKNDISRSGLKPYIIQNNFELSPSDAQKISKNWAKILADILIGGQLKLSGTIQSIGIADPITVGDNLEFNNVVYHIEQIVHTALIDPRTGIKTFRTNLSLSHGISVNSDIIAPKYSQMTFVSGQSDREADYNGNENFIPENILPGISESQDVSSREDLDTSKFKENSFPQPDTTGSTFNREGE